MCHFDASHEVFSPYSTNFLVSFQRGVSMFDIQIFSDKLVDLLIFIEKVLLPS